MLYQKSEEKGQSQFSAFKHVQDFSQDLWVHVPSSLTISILCHRRCSQRKKSHFENGIQNLLDSRQSLYLVT
jgi:hypothetical protein